MTSLIGLLVFAAPQASRPPLIHFCQINLSPSLVMAMGRFPLQCLTGDNAKESEYERHARVTTWAAKMNFPKAASAATLLNASPETRADNVGALLVPHSRRECRVVNSVGASWCGLRGWHRRVSSRKTSCARHAISAQGLRESVRAVVAAAYSHDAVDDGLVEHVRSGSVATVEGKKETT